MKAQWMLCWNAKTGMYYFIVSLSPSRGQSRTFCKDIRLLYVPVYVMSFQLCFSAWIPCIPLFKYSDIIFKSSTYSYIFFILLLCSLYWRLFEMWYLCTADDKWFCGRTRQVCEVLTLGNVRLLEKDCGSQCFRIQKIR